MTAPRNDDAGLVDRIGAYLEKQTGRRVRVSNLKRYPVGFSWITVGFSVDGLPEGNVPSELILRLGPDFGLYGEKSSLPQALALQSVEGTGMPAPRVYWFGDDPAPFGAPFLITEKARGNTILPWISKHTKPIDESLRVSLGEHFTDALAALHRIDWASRPFAPLGSGVTVRNAARLEIDRWEKGYQQWAQRPFPMFEWGVRWLRQHCPEAPRLSIVHGDYRLGNFLDADGKITAMLDWELAHVGDPHDDLGWLSLPMYMGGTKYLCRLVEPEVFYRRYEEKSGIAVSPRSLKFWRAVNLLKLAATHMAAAHCFESGRLHDMRLPAMGTQIHTCLKQLERTIEAAP